MAVTEYVSLTSVRCSALFEEIIFKDMKADFGHIKGWVILLNNFFYFVPLSITNTESYFFSPFSRREGGTRDESSHFLPSCHEYLKDILL